ncbi:Sec23/Sec24 trunk domain protein [Paragonimus heterotremus]|uniref:Sec23/Sec24 trunk domain protein n=1 Tax=Paragonimus heterotremus TaxID=100268 RepID=A0A8J4WIZ3_9TREM|nr:Sec23/Sec24 trunk domain protein [Paragonimus heterotremus]
MPRLSSFQQSPEQHVTSPPSINNDYRKLSSISSPTADISGCGRLPTSGTANRYMGNHATSANALPRNSNVDPTTHPNITPISVVPFNHHSNNYDSPEPSISGRPAEPSSLNSAPSFGLQQSVSNQQLPSSTPYANSQTVCFSGQFTDPTSEQTRHVPNSSPAASNGSQQNMLYYPSASQPSCIQQHQSTPPLKQRQVPVNESSYGVASTGLSNVEGIYHATYPPAARDYFSRTSQPSGERPISDYAPSLTVDRHTGVPTPPIHKPTSTPPCPPPLSNNISQADTIPPPHSLPTTTANSTKVNQMPNRVYPVYPPSVSSSSQAIDKRTFSVPPHPISYPSYQPSPPNAHLQSASVARDPRSSSTHSQSAARPDMTQPFPPTRPVGSDQSAVFRSPGSSSTLAEWNHIKAPIGLLQEYQLLPSDSADLPSRPAVSPVNCDPDIMRCTLNNFPSTAKLLARCRLPLGLVMHPFRDLSSLHTINSTVIVRCRSCRTYINPFVQFLDSGRRWRCPVCFLSNSVPEDFFYDPETQTYGNPARRPEIRSATVEFIAPPEYMLRPPQPATYLFCLDVSRTAIASGYLRFVCERLAASLKRMPGDSRRQIGFITFDSAIHFYKLCGDAMRVMICPDLEEPFLPDYEGLINRIEDSSEALQDFLLRLPDSFASTTDLGNCLGSTLQIGLKLIGGNGGRITAFNTCLPNTGAGSLQMREEQNDRITPDIKKLGPAIDFYKTLALDCAAQQVAVDLFIMNSQYCDIATLSGAARFSGGCVYHYPDFYCPPSACQTGPTDLTAQAGNTFDSTTPPHSLTTDQTSSSSAIPIELERFRRDFERYLSRKIGFEAVMRIRCTHGLSIQAFHGSFFVRSTDLMSLPNVSPDAGFAVQLGISESVDKYSSVCCQAAILYTSAKGDRRIRVHTLCLPVVHNASEVFQGADQGTIACLIGKMAVDRAINSGVQNAREAMANSVADVLTAFALAIGLTAVSSISSYSMACPPCLRLLALYVCGLLRYPAFRVGSPVRIDDRSAALERLKSAPPDDMLTLIYPRLYAVHQFVSKPVGSSNLTLAQKAATLCLSDYGDAQVEWDQHSGDGESTSSDTNELMYEAEQLPGQLHLSSRNIARTGVYLLDTGECLFLLVGAGEDSAAGSTASSEMLRQLLGISSPSELPVQGGPFALPAMDPNPDKKTASNNPSSLPIARRRLMALINLIRRRRPTNNALICMRHDAPATLRTRFLSALIEDRTEFAPSYPEFLQMIQTIMKA